LLCLFFLMCSPKKMAAVHTLTREEASWTTKPQPYQTDTNANRRFLLEDVPVFTPMAREP
jgi:hypothetical protein